MKNLTETDDKFQSLNFVIKQLTEKFHNAEARISKYKTRAAPDGRKEKRTLRRTANGVKSGGKLMFNL